MRFSSASSVAGARLLCDEAISPSAAASGTNAALARAAVSAIGNSVSSRRSGVASSDSSASASGSQRAERPAQRTTAVRRSVRPGSAASARA